MNPKTLSVAVTLNLGVVCKRPQDSSFKQLVEVAVTLNLGVVCKAPDQLLQTQKEKDQVAVTLNLGVVCKWQSSAPARVSFLVAVTLNLGVVCKRPPSNALIRKAQSGRFGGPTGSAVPDRRKWPREPTSKRIFPLVINALSGLPPLQSTRCPAARPPHVFGFPRWKCVLRSWRSK